jgi:hypothetical protein
MKAKKFQSNQKVAIEILHSVADLGCLSRFQIFTHYLPLICHYQSKFIFLPSCYLSLSPGNTVNINYVSILISSYVFMSLSIYIINKVVFLRL